MKTEYIEPFIQSTIATIEEFFYEKADDEAYFPYLATENDKVPTKWAISAVIGISGDAKGVVVISLGAELAQLLAGKVLGTPMTEVNDLVVDVMGEAVNIIAGNAKQGLEKDFKLTISLPTIMRGNALKAAWPAGASVMLVPFKIRNHVMELAVGFTPNSAIV